MKLSGPISIYKENPTNVEWKEINVQLSYITIYKVYYTEYNKKKLIKPFTKILQSEFEDLFAFNCQCRDYDPNRIIDITNAV